MKSFILALATALPQYSLDQDLIARKISQAFKLTPELQENLHKLYEKTAIKRRYSVLSDIEKPVREWEFWGSDFPYELPSTKARNDIYCKEAPELALTTAKKVLKKWNGNPQDITHIISVSCTGVLAPGIEFILQQKLDLNPTVERIGINLMGCFGAFRALSVASSLAKQNPKNRILVVCTELCSLHMQVSFDPEVTIGNALFSDGSAAAIIGCCPEKDEKPLWSIEKTGSYAIKNSLEKMTWKVSDSGFVMGLSRQVPELIGENITDFAKYILDGIDFQDCIWAIHPGGKRIIEIVEEKCGLSKEQTESSWTVLKKYGNMSSATFLFVLEELENADKKNVLGIGFGPGLACEGILLKK